jgi:putative ABC transport system permease protein
MALMIQMLVGLFVPLIAGLAPVVNGSRITVLRALSGGLADDEPNQTPGEETRVPWFDWVQVKATRILAARGIHIPRPFVISLRNTFRRKSRLALTLSRSHGRCDLRRGLQCAVTLRVTSGRSGSISLPACRRTGRTGWADRANAASGRRGRVEGWRFVSGELLDKRRVLENINVFGPPAAVAGERPVAGRWIRRRM